MYEYVRVYDENLNLLREISDFNSLIYTERNNTIGEWELHLREPDRDVFRLGRYIRVGDNPYMSGRIEYEFENGDGLDRESSDDYTVKGCSLLSIIAQRITVPPTKGDGYWHYTNKPAEDILYDLIDKHVINPELSARKIPLFTTGVNLHRGKRITVDLRFKNLAEVIFEICEQSELSVRIALDAEAKKFVFEVYQGVDRTQDNPDKYFVTRRFDRVDKQTFEHSIIGVSNYAYVLGQGDGAKRTQVEIGTATGIDRKELYVDARDVADTVDDDPNYNAKESLKARGNEKLLEVQEACNLEFVVSSRDYGELFNLGDKLKYVSDDAYTEETGLVSEAEHVWEESVHKVTIKLGNSTVNILQALTSASNAAGIERTGVSGKFDEIDANLIETTRLIAQKVDAHWVDTHLLTADQIEADYVKIVRLNAELAEIENLLAQKAYITDLNATNAEIDNLHAIKANVDDLNAVNATIEDLKAKDAEIDLLVADKATITDLNAWTARVGLVETNLLQHETSLVKVTELAEMAQERAEEALFFRVVIDSSKGTVFKNGVGETILQGKLVRGKTPVTDIPHEIRWVRNDTTIATGEQITVRASDVDDATQYRAIAVKDDEVLAEAEITVVNVVDGHDAISLYIDSSNGVMFKNSAISTVFTVVIRVAGEGVYDSATMYTMFGNDARIIWRMDGAELDSSDSRLSDNGFILTLNTSDIQTKAVFTCELDF